MPLSAALPIGSIWCGRKLMTDALNVDVNETLGADSGAGSRSATVGQLSKLRAFQSEERAFIHVGVSLEANWAA